MQLLICSAFYLFTKPVHVFVLTSIMLILLELLAITFGKMYNNVPISLFFLYLQKNMLCECTDGIAAKFHFTLCNDNRGVLLYSYLIYSR